jgi:hypothetical protein
MHCRSGSNSYRLVDCNLAIYCNQYLSCTIHAVFWYSTDLGGRLLIMRLPTTKFVCQSTIFQKLFYNIMLQNIQLISEWAEC